MHYLKDLRDRFLEAMSYSWPMRICFLVTLVSGYFAVTWVDAYHPQPGWIGFVVYMASAMACLVIMYPETWND